MGEHVKTFLDAFLAGIVIGIGGVVYLGVENRIAGSLLFTVGLYAIVLNQFALYTGNIGYALGRPLAYMAEMGVVWFGNLCGTFTTGTLVSFTRLKTARAAAGICAVKLEDSLSGILILAFFCGMLMYIAVDGYKSKGNPVILFLGVSVFILAGFEHCIANMFYFTVAGVWSLKALVYILVMTLGNSAGGMFIPFIRKVGQRT